MTFILWVCAAVAGVLLWMWGVAGFTMPERPSYPDVTHEKRDVGNGCTLHYYSDRRNGTTKWVTCTSGETVTFDRKGCGKRCSRDEAVEVRKEPMP